MSKLALSESLSKKIKHLHKEQSAHSRSDLVLASRVAARLSAGVVSSYLTPEGEVLVDYTSVEDIPTVKPATEEEVSMYLFVGAKIHGLTELLAFIPEAPPGSVVCPTCNGTGMRMNEMAKKETFCYPCFCRGWIYQE